MYCQNRVVPCVDRLSAVKSRVGLFIVIVFCVQVLAKRCFFLILFSSAVGESSARFCDTSISHTYLYHG